MGSILCPVVPIQAILRISALLIFFFFLVLSHTPFCAYLVHINFSISPVFLWEQAGALLGFLLMIQCAQQGFDSTRPCFSDVGAWSGLQPFLLEEAWEGACAPAIAGISISRSGLWGADVYAGISSELLPIVLSHWIKV